MMFYIKDNYYFDIDLQNQLRISGPENHLFLGLTFPKNAPVEMYNYALEKGNLIIYLKIRASEVKLPIPIVTDIRTLRGYTEQISPRPTYKELLEEKATELLPKSTKSVFKNGRSYFEFMNVFTDDAGNRKKYGSIISVDSKHKAEIIGNEICISGKQPMVVKIETRTNIKITNRLRRKVFRSSYSLPRQLFTPELLEIYDKSQTFVEHLIRSKKTSSFEYGTIFPRDWIESADLGLGDLSQETVDYMYDQSMSFISDTGEAWHENIIGEFKTKITDVDQHIDRKMIDIEPRYIMGMKQVSKKFLTADRSQEKLKAVANYILEKAETQEAISFKKMSTQSEDENYFFVGNWRDSLQAYPGQKSPLSPYDVNCVFYPIALRTIREYYTFFGLKDLTKLNELIEKWDHQKDKFRLYHTQNLIGYSLALHGKKQLPMPVAHLDESYDLFYGAPSLEEIVSFAKKVMDPNFFYTPVGPILVDIDADMFSTQQYHGKVIWPKQAAYTVAGLAKQFRRGLKEGWPWPVIETIKAAVITTSEACFKGWTELGAVPELYYYDEKTQKARFYTDQEEFEGQMSLIQLWSSVGCRRIMQDYASVMKIAEAV